MIKYTLIFGILCTSTFVHASPIPPNQCAIVVTSSPDKQKTAAALLKYKAAFEIPLIIQSNNGMYAGAIGLYERKDSKSILESLKLNELIPKDAYCDNNQRFVSAQRYSINGNGELVEVPIEPPSNTIQMSNLSDVIGNNNQKKSTETAQTESQKTADVSKLVEAQKSIQPPANGTQSPQRNNSENQVSINKSTSNNEIRDYVDQKKFLSAIAETQDNLRAKLEKAPLGSRDHDKFSKEYTNYFKNLSGGSIKEWKCVWTGKPHDFNSPDNHIGVRDEGEYLRLMNCNEYSKAGVLMNAGKKDIRVHFLQRYDLRVSKKEAIKIGKLYTRDELIFSGKIADVLSKDEIFVNVENIKLGVSVK